MTFSQDPLYNYLNVQIVVNENNNKYYFPDLPQLRDAKIVGISFYPTISATNNVDINNVPLISVADAQNAYLTLYSGEIEALQNIPLIKLLNVYFNDVGAGGQYFGNPEGIFAINDLVIDFSKSYVSIAPTATITGALPQSISFGIYYKK